MKYPIMNLPHGELVPRFVTDELVRADYCIAVKPGSTFSEDKFVARHSFAAYVMVNVHLSICQDLGGIAVVAALKGLYTSKKLKGTIAWLGLYSQFVLTHYGESTTMRPEFASAPEEIAFWYAIQKLSIKSVRQICLFPKRFGFDVPKKSSLAHEDAIASFVEEQSRLQHVVVPQLESLENSDCCNHEAKAVLLLARWLVKNLVGEEPKLKPVSIPLLGPGTARNCSSKTRYGKLEYLIQNGEYIPTVPPQFVRYVQHPDSVVRVRNKQAKKPKATNYVRYAYGALSKYAQVCCLTTVAKDTSKRRLIAKEDPCCMAQQLRIKDTLDAIIRKHRWGNALPLHDQSVNQRLACSAVITNWWATLDLSAASDTVTKKLVQMLFPESWNRAFMTAIPVGYITDEHDRGPRYLYSFGTMGCGCTFIVEAIVFWAVSCACCMRQMILNGSSLAEAIRFPDANRCTAYGDDIIMPTFGVDLFLRVAPIFGFKVNESKSFWSGRFRESCGADWWLESPKHAIDITPSYWPRHPVSGRKDELLALKRGFRNGEVVQSSTLETLISLQHQLYDVSPTASAFLSQTILAEVPYLSSCSERSDDVACLYGDDDCRYLEAYYVGEKVPLRFRQPGFELLRFDGRNKLAKLPEYYIQRDCVWEYIKWSEQQTGSESLFRNPEYRRRSQRRLYVQPGHEYGSADEILDINMVRSILYDSFLTKEPTSVAPVTLRRIRGLTYDEFSFKSWGTSCIGSRSELLRGLCGNAQGTLTIVSL